MQKDAIKAKQTENPYHQSSIYEKNAPIVVDVPALRYRQYHEMDLKTRVEILYFLCQMKIDNESAEFVSEVQHFQSRKLKEELHIKLKPFARIS